MSRKIIIFRPRRLCYLDSEQMAGAKGLLSLPLVTERRKLRQLQLNRKLTFAFLPRSAAHLVPETLPAPCQEPFSSPCSRPQCGAQFLLRVSPSSSETPREAPATSSESPAGVGTREGQKGPGRGRWGPERGWWGPGKG